MITSGDSHVTRHARSKQVFLDVMEVRAWLLGITKAAVNFSSKNGVWCDIH